MLRVLALTCLLAAAAAQSHYYCGPSPTSTITDRDFYLTTRGSKDVGYQAGQVCEFNAESSTSAFSVEIQSFQVGSAVVTISSGGVTLFSGSSLQKHQSIIATPSKSLQVRFDASGDTSHSAGVTLRVRAFDVNGCPSGWAYLYNNCFGTNNLTGSLDYFDAQRACNNMRSNLMHLPATYPYGVGSFVRLLPYHLKSFYTWIGITDRTSYGQYRHYWLNGERYFQTSEISCRSTGGYLTCYSTERCGTVYERSPVYSVFMDNCYIRNSYVCSAPPYGTSTYYRVPDSTTYISTYVGISAWVWGVVVGGFFVVGLIVAGIYTAVRQSNIRRSPGAASVVVSTGRVTVPPPSTSYPQQQRIGAVAFTAYPAQPYPAQPYPAQPYPTGQAMNAPPTYEAAAGGGYGNSGFQGNK